MAELSPAAQEVLDAFICCPVETSDQLALAAALRAAVDQVVPEENVDDADYHCLYAKWAAGGKQEVRDEMLAIAAELHNNATHK